MATHSSVLAWRVPGMGELGGLPSTGSHRVGHDRCDLAAAAAAMLISYIYTHMFTFRFFPIQVITEYRVESPVLSIQQALIS